MNAIVTTAGRPDRASLELADYACMHLSLPFKERKKRSVVAMMKEYQSDIVVAGKNRFEYYGIGSKSPFFFHPNSAAFRLKRVLSGEEDPFIQATGLRLGDSILDCTLGMGSDSIIASHIVGAEGKIVGCEAHPIIAFIVKEGMTAYSEGGRDLLESMRRVQVISADSIEYMAGLSDDSFDVVYMDPMFDEEIQESDNFQPLRHAGLHTPLTDRWVSEAFRIARKKIVLKAHYRSTIFEDFGFQQQIRPTSKFHYGIRHIT